MELWTKGKFERERMREGGRESCFMAVFKSEFKAQLLTTFEPDFKLWGKKIQPSRSSVLAVSSKDHRKRATKAEADQVFLFRKLFSSNRVVSELFLSRDGSRNPR